MTEITRKEAKVVIKALNYGEVVFDEKLTEDEKMHLVKATVKLGMLI